MLQTKDGIFSVRAGRIGRPGSIAVVLLWIGVASAQSAAGGWRAATDKELKSLLPARATVEKEHIETEMRTASGITDGHGKFVAGIVLMPGLLRRPIFALPRTVPRPARCRLGRCSPRPANTSSVGSAKRTLCMCIFTTRIPERNAGLFSRSGWRGMSASCRSRYGRRKPDPSSGLDASV